MRTQGRKVPEGMIVGVAVSLLMAACGGDARPAEDEESLRVIPPAEDPTEASEPETGEPGVADEGPEGSEEREAEPESAVDAMAEPVRPSPEADPEPVEADRARERAEPTRPVDEESPAREHAEETGAPRDTVETPERTVEPVVSEPARPAPGEEVRPADVRREAPPLTVPAGTEAELVMETSLSTRDDPAGTFFQARLVEDLLGSAGMVLLPRGTVARGRVVESRESPDSDEPAVLRLAFEEIRVDGRFLPLRATILDIQMKADARDSDAEVGAKVGAGAVAGAILGKILGKSGEDALKGAVAGAAAGAAYAIATRDGHAEVREGAVLRIVLDERLVLEGW